MILTTEYKGRNVLILGFGTSGESLAASLSTSGAIVWIWDDNPNTLLKAKKIGFNTFNPYEDEIWNIIDLLLVSPGISTSGSSSHELVIKARFLGIMIDNDIGLFFKLLKSSRDTFNVRPKVVAVTGSNGKSTTASLIHHILLYAGVKTQFGGNIGKSVFDLTPLKNEEIIVLELSSYQLESANSLSPDIAVFTNFSPDHLERHGGVQGYFEAKKRLFQDGLPSISIINTDSLEGQKLRSDVHGESIEICSGCTDIQKGWIVQNSNQTLIEYKNGIKKFSFNLKKFENLPGSHNHENIGLAYATCIGIGVEKNKIMEALETFVGLPHRLQFIGEKHGVKYINDSKATNPDSATKALSAFRNIHWICGGKEKEGSPLSLKDSLKFVKKAYIIGKNPSTFALKLEDLPYTICDTMDMAVLQATDAAKAGEVILLSPAAASFDQYKNFEKRGEHFIRLVNKIL